MLPAIAGDARSNGTPQTEVCATKQPRLSYGYDVYYAAHHKWEQLNYAKVRKMHTERDLPFRFIFQFTGAFGRESIQPANRCGPDIAGRASDYARLSRQRNA